MRGLMWFLALCVSALLAVMCVEMATAQDDSLRQDLARVLVGEADGAESDWAAILWTLEHRRERSGLSMEAISKYSAVLRADSDRSRRMRTLGTSAPDFGELASVRQRHYVRALHFIDRWRAGAVKDPCPKSLHWGGYRDSKPPKRTTVICGPTMNEFYFCKDRSC